MIDLLSKPLLPFVNSPLFGMPIDLRGVEYLILFAALRLVYLYCKIFITEKAKRHARRPLCATRWPSPRALLQSTARRQPASVERKGTIVTVSTLKIGKREFVVVPRKDFERLRRKAELSSEDAGDVAESSRRMKERGGSTLEDVRKKLKL
jgi:hypothetical protein